MSRTVDGDPDQLGDKMADNLKGNQTGYTCAGEEQPTVRLRKSLPALDPEPTTVSGIHGSAASAETLDDACSPIAALAKHANLIRELHATDPAAAARLAEALTAMPPVGAEFFGFRLLAELGHGGLSWVFLATQGELADRHVVLKVAPDIWGEAQTLAKLQHPNIVPIFSVHQREPFQAVCMPYLGWTTLQDVLNEIHALPSLPTSGGAFVRAFKKKPVVAADPTHLPVAESAPAAEFVEKASQMSYVEAVVWLAVQMADGLAHAHAHGIVHHDLKPANVLLTDDGKPMLLDFNAAEDIKRTGAPLIAWVVGTFPYMAPEQLVASKDRPRPVDARSDLYGFGIILFELLTGLYPFVHRHPATALVCERVLEERRAGPPSLRELNPAVSPALEAIVHRCLEADPNRRYQTAQELLDDLRRQHTHLPLRHVTEPSLLERMQKWVRRHPLLLTEAVVAVFASMIAAMLSILFLSRGNELYHLGRQQSARVQLEHQRHAAASSWRRFQDDMKTARFLLYTQTTEAEQLADGMALGAKLVRTYEVLDNPNWRQTTLVQALPEPDRRQLEDSMSELLLLLARALTLQQGDAPNAAQSRAGLEKALRMNLRAAEGSAAAAASPALWHQRARLSTLLGRKADADQCAKKAKALPLRTGADHYWLASELMSAGRLREALPLLQKATRAEPQNFWAWFVLANCCDRLAMDARAEAAYGTCIALKPDSVWAHFHRGLALSRQQHYRPACDDFDAVLALRPDLVEAYLNRALARQGLQQFADAEHDLTAALERGGPTRLYFLRARVRENLGDKAGAQRDLDDALRTPPQDEKSCIARGIHQLQRDPLAALADFEAALQLNPRSADALRNKALVLTKKLGRNQDALQALNRLVELYPDSAPALSGRGVLHARLGQRAAAVRDAEDTLRLDATAPRLYEVACVYALTSKQHPDDRIRAFELLSSALRSGYGFQDLEFDTNLDPIRQALEFRRLVDAARALRLAPSALKKT